MSRLVTIYNPDNPVARSAIQVTRDEARRAHAQLTERHAHTLDEVRAITQGIKPQEFDAFFQISDAMVTAQAPVMIEILREKRLPSMFDETSLCTDRTTGREGA